MITHHPDLLDPVKVNLTRFAQTSQFSRLRESNMVWVIVCWLVTWGVVVVCLQTFSSAQVIGTVVSAHGTWCDDSQKPCAALWRMYPIQRDSKLVRVPPTNGQESVTIRTRWGTKEIFDCTNPRELGCKSPLDLSRIVPQEKPKNVVTAFFDAVTELAADRPNVYETFREGILQVRGSGGQVLSDGVAKLSKQGLSLENILVRLDAGDYLLELCLLNNSGEPKCPDQSAPQKFSWNTNNSGLFPAIDVHAGIYRLYLWNGSTGTPRRSREYADVLVADEARYQTLSDDFRQVVEATRNWDAEDSTAPALRRAYLYTLARQ